MKKFRKWENVFYIHQFNRLNDKVRFEYFPVNGTYMNSFI